MKLKIRKYKAVNGFLNPKYREIKRHEFKIRIESGKNSLCFVTTVKIISDGFSVQISYKSQTFQEK